MATYGGINGVKRKLNEWPIGIGGVVKQQKEVWATEGGVKRKIFSTSKYTVGWFNTRPDDTILNIGGSNRNANFGSLVFNDAVNAKVTIPDPYENLQVFKNGVLVGRSSPYSFEVDKNTYIYAVSFSNPVVAILADDGTKSKTIEVTGAGAEKKQGSQGQVFAKLVFKKAEIVSPFIFSFDEPNISVECYVSSPYGIGGVHITVNGYEASYDYKNNYEAKYTAICSGNTKFNLSHTSTTGNIEIIATA